MRTLFNLEMPVEKTMVMSLGYAEEENVLICGSRESALLIYRLPDHTSVPNESILALIPSLQLRRSHGKQAITSILVKKDQDVIDVHDQADKDEVMEDEDDEEGVIFWSTGRDGCYVQYRLKLTENRTDNNHETTLGIASRGDTVITGRDMVLEKLYRNKVTKGTLEGSLLLEGQLLLLGFFRKNLFVYNEQKNFVMVAINCGGGHRRWGYSTEDAKLNKSAFAFIRKEVLYAYFRDTTNMTDGFNDSILQNNYHGREVRALCFLPLLTADSNGNQPMLFATGGEDTILRIQQYMPDVPSKFINHVSIRKHTTVIKNISYSQGISSLLFTSGGLEEFRCWKIEATPAKIPGGPVNLNCLEVASCHTLTEEIESRIMDTAVFAIDPQRGLHIIGAVYSDAMIRFWLFNEVTRKFSLVADGTWHAKCILQIAYVKLGQHLYFFTSATDGRVAMWDISDQLYQAIENPEVLEQEPTKAAFRLQEPVHHFSVHMSGVNALEAVPFRDNQHILVTTGGEDNAVSATLVNTVDNTTVGKSHILPSAHASSVTGIKYMDDAVFTCSTDQRLNKWSIHDLGTEGVSMTLVDATYMDVPDPSALDAVIFK